MEPPTEHPTEAENSQPTEAPAAAAETPKSPTNGAVMDVVAPPPTDKVEAPAGTEGTEAAQGETPAPVVNAKPPKPVAPKQPRGPGVSAAIVGTVVIVLGLAIIAAYAFLKSR